MKLPQLNHILVLLVKILIVKSHYWPNGYNRVSRDHTWSTSPVSSYSSSRRSQYQYQQQLYQAPQQLYQQPQQLYQQPQQFYSSPVVQQQQPPVSRSWSQPRNSVLKRGWPVKGDTFPSYADRCGSCVGEPQSQVCGSDGKTYRNSCELKYISCKKYWDLREVSKGSCSQDCPGVDLGMYTGWGLSRASNKGYCHHDFFRCCKSARKAGLGANQVRSCCQARADKCFAFVAEKPWRSGVAKYGK